MNTNTDKTKLSSKVQKVLGRTVKQKAIMIIKGFEDQCYRFEKPYITSKEVKVIINTMTQEEKKTYVELSKCYDKILSFSKSIAVAKLEYETEIQRLLYYCQIWESMDRTASDFNNILQAVKDTGSKEAAEAVRMWIDNYKPLHDSKRLYAKIKEIRKEAETRLSIYKSAVVAVEELMAKYDCRDVIPDIVLSYVDSGKEDYALRISPKYSRQRLLEKKAKGYIITAEEERRAVFPSFKEAKIIKRYYIQFQDYLSID